MTERDHTPTAIIERGKCEMQVHPLNILQMAVQSGNIDTAALEKLMDLAERHEANEARKAYAAAMVGLKRDLPGVLHKDKQVGFESRSGGSVRYSHTTLGAAVDAILDHLTQHGFSHSWIPNNDDKMVRVTCRLTHSQGHSEEATMSAPPDNSGKKSPAQAIASTNTLLQRYTMLSLLGIATADMTEPEPEEHDPDTVDSKAAMHGMRVALDLGYEKDAIEGSVGKPMSQWTTGDLEVLRLFLRNEIMKKLEKCKTVSDVKEIGAQLKTLNLRGQEREESVGRYKSKLEELASDRMREPGEEG